MRGVREDIFAGLVRNPSVTSEAFVTEATTIELVLQVLASLYQQLLGVTVSTMVNCDLESSTRDFREVTRGVVREGLRKPAASRQAFLSIVEAAREDVQRALQPEVTVNTTVAKDPTLSYAAMARRSPPPRCQNPVPP